MSTHLSSCNLHIWTFVGNCSAAKTSYLNWWWYLSHLPYTFPTIRHRYLAISHGILVNTYTWVLNIIFFTLKLIDLKTIKALEW
jgi:hypothetical protein